MSSGIVITFLNAVIYIVKRGRQLGLHWSSIKWDCVISIPVSLLSNQYIFRGPTKPFMTL